MLDLVLINVTIFRFIFFKKISKILILNNKIEICRKKSILKCSTQFLTLHNYFDCSLLKIFELAEVY
jgi:hypothetical protein